jgi:hypothetical protein
VKRWSPMPGHEYTSGREISSALADLRRLTLQHMADLKSGLDRGTGNPDNRSIRIPRSHDFSSGLTHLHI